MSARDRHHHDTGPLDPQRARMLVEHVCRDPEGTPARTLVLAAQPGDETIGASWLLAQLPEVQVLHLTDGAPQADGVLLGGVRRWSEYAGLRRAELLAAMAHAGVGPSQCRRLGLADGQAWRDLDTLVWGVVDAFMTWTPDLILTHAYEGGHPDHDAAAFAAQAAVGLLARMQLPTPAIAEFASFHRGGATGLVTGEFLQRAQPVFEVTLGIDERRRKRAMFLAHASQRRLLEAFGVERELYRAAPRYDFTTAPHAGPLFYETQPGGPRGAVWRRHAAAVLARLRGAVPGHDWRPRTVPTRRAGAVGGAARAS